jgi:hypothetical protein
LHEKAIREEELHQTEVDVSLAESEEDKQAAFAVVEELQGEIAMMEAETVRLEVVRQKARTTIDLISSWEDVDAIVR